MRKNDKRDGDGATRRARKVHVCAQCGDLIEKGDSYRQVGDYDPSVLGGNLRRLCMRCADHAGGLVAEPPGYVEIDENGEYKYHVGAYYEPRDSAEYDETAALERAFEEALREN